MLNRIITYSIQHKLIILLFTTGIIGFGIFAMLNISIGAVPDITNNQVQVITTSRNLATEDVEKFLTYPVELEMANLPGVNEIRSVSKFGLSVVTVVFDDDMGTYLPRQLIAEKIKSAEEKIPAGFGKPFMGPVSTGLGEIYQYIIEVDENFKDNYSLTDIRSIQDWIVKRQLSGIKGVVEVNTWGGYLKTYEVAVKPDRLRAMNISVEEVFNALDKNNNIAGGAYIEKNNESFFIRGEGLINNLKDIEEIVVTQKQGAPIYVRNIAEVGFGYANRFGAITGNGEGEKVLGQVMMLKDANSNAVINSVKERVAAIQKNLPPGITINPFLERSELISKTTFTIAENLILGCLIVIFIVVLLLGNLRSGLVIASVIPLSLLFALSLMYVFDVDANLMSLGAIDFGIIIDGAVIIVEFIAYKMMGERNKLNTLKDPEKQVLTDEITYKSATKMMNSAVFGQLIIIIVFIPILSLVGVEGKMFRPMALTFCFALLGAMLLCFTYVPVMASLFIKPANPDRKTISQQLIGFLQKKYHPVLIWSLRKRKWVLGLALGLFAFTISIYSGMGGEFVPTLDEGDFVIQPILKTGTSLSKTIEATTKIEKILLKFPEVEQVVSRIGAAEIPTDPMSMEDSDVIIKLKPKNEWVFKGSKDELADKFKNALSEIAGVDYEFTQPIEMRFNELITGVRADLAIKIFGEDLNILHNKALEIEKAIRDVEGAADISVEKIAGLPQVSIKYKRSQIAKYGLNIADLNRIVTIGFAGMPTGTVFEGEKQFDLVIRFHKDARQDLENIKNTTVLLDSGSKLPFHELAEVAYTKGPAKISRDNTKRRIVIGVNVRNRDIESVVNDVKNIVDSKIDIPTGYSVSYGGQFENFKTAVNRFKIAVPISLVLIFLLLYIAFDSVKYALMIYSAIPLSAIGGVMLLYFRGMPFSISAGVGFIALFGIAVLNGIVLIEEFKELESEGAGNIFKRVIKGSKNRLRPVLLTASAAALGFLPMAISNSAGAEVQCPLATVVIGGLITATLLTLVILPVLYSLFDDKKPFKIQIPPNSSFKKNIMLIAILVCPLFLEGQKLVNAEEAVEIALHNNKELVASQLKIKQSNQLKGSAFNLPKTQFYYHRDENNVAANGLPLNVLGVSQSFEFPTVYGAMRRVKKNQTEQAVLSHELQKRKLSKEVFLAYYNIVYHKSLIREYQFLDSLYQQFSYAANRKFELGETNKLEKLTANAKQKEINVLLSQTKEGLIKANTQFQRWVQTDSTLVVKEDVLPRLELKEFDIEKHPGVLLNESAYMIAESALSLEKQRLLPDLQITLFQGTNNGENARRYNGIQAGISIPVWFSAAKSKIDAAKTETMIILDISENYKIALEAKYKALISDLNKYAEVLNYYEATGKELSDELGKTATKAFKSGEIDFLQYTQLLESAKHIKITYLENLSKYNSTILELNFITN